MWSQRLLSKLRFDTILPKKVLKVLASSSLFVIVLLISLNVMHSLWKAFTEKRELKVLQSFLLSVTILLFKFPRLSLLFLHKILTQRFLCLLGVIHIWRPLCGWGEGRGGIKENWICALNRHSDESKINII